MVATHWLEQWPSDFSGCVIINSSFKGLSPVYQRLRPRALVHLIRIATESDIEKRERNILAMVSNRPEIYDETAKEWARISNSRPVSPENFLRQIMAASRFRMSLRFPSQPILVLNSRFDRMVHPDCSLQIAEMWGCEIRRHPTAGHDLPLDAGQWTAEQIVGWSRRL
jgi:pimeloyl-ACP methyl ester carboxylesterase